MKKFVIVTLFAFTQLNGISQSLGERAKIIMEFEKCSDTEIELFNIETFPKQLDSIQLKSDFLKRKKINY